jgi:hypothetical protein
VSAGAGPAAERPSAFLEGDKPHQRAVLSLLVSARPTLVGLFKVLPSLVLTIGLVIALLRLVGSSPPDAPHDGDDYMNSMFNRLYLAVGALFLLAFLTPVLIQIGFRMIGRA